MSLSLWKKIQENDVQAFDDFYHQYVSSLYNYGMSITNQSDLVEEAIQLLFTSLYQKRHTIAIKSSPKSYLITSLRRLIIEQMNKLNNYDDLDFDAGLDFSVPSHEDKIVNVDNQNEQLEKLNLAKSTLTKRQTEVIYLKFDQGLSYDEISLIMNLTKDASYKLVNQALKRLTENF